MKHRTTTAVKTVSRPEAGPALLLLLLLAAVLLTVGAARAGESASAEAVSATETATTTAAAESDTTGANAEEDDRSPLEKLRDMDPNDPQYQQLREEMMEEQSDIDLPFFISLTHQPTAGLKAGVRSSKLYTDLVSTQLMGSASSATNTAKWSWEDFRQQDKTSEKRSDAILYKEGELLPGSLTLNLSRDWSRDETLNNAGLTNIAKRDLKIADLNYTSRDYVAGRFTSLVRGVAGGKDQKAVSLGVHNDFNEASVGGAVQSSYQVADGLKVTGRVFGRTKDGERSLGTTTSPSSAVDDTLSFRVKIDRRYLQGSVDIARANFEEEFLDFNKNASGLIDTTGLNEADKIVEEMRTQDATRIRLDAESRLGAWGFKTRLERKTNDLDYQANRLGRTEKLEDDVDLSVFRASGRDSMAVRYAYGWAWDDQQNKGATVKRGRQYVKDRALNLYWEHRFFRKTIATMKLQQSLAQNIAENAFNQNDRDRVRQDFTIDVERQWGASKTGFWTGLLFAYKSAEDISIRSTRSSNNNIKDSYEVAPGYEWPIAGWLELSQYYRVYIQYTDYVFSDLESVNKDDDYNKRSNMNTAVTLRPSRRLTVVIKHDYNKRFNATYTSTDATGNEFYHIDDRQTTSKVDLAVRFTVMQGLVLEGATYNSLDEKEKTGTRATITQKEAGEVWAGAKFNKSFGPKSNAVDVYAMVKKYYAYGPAVTETSDDYWEADVWLKWKF